MTSHHKYGGERLTPTEFTGVKWVGLIPWMSSFYHQTGSRVRSSRVLLLLLRSRRKCLPKCLPKRLFAKRKGKNFSTFVEGSEETVVAQSLLSSP